MSNPQAEIYGLTLHQPWAWLVASGIKRIENRPWKPPEKLYGQFFAIHAGGTYSLEAEEKIKAQGVGLKDGAAERFAVIGVARLVGLMEGTAEEPFLSKPPKFELDDQRYLRWFFGPFGWVLEDIKTFKPIPCRGYQRIWHLPPDVLKAVQLNIWGAST